LFFHFIALFFFFFQKQERIA